MIRQDTYGAYDASFTPEDAAAMMSPATALTPDVRDYYEHTILRVCWELLMCLINPSQEEREAFTLQILQIAHLDILAMAVKVLNARGIGGQNAQRLLDEIAEHSTMTSKTIRNELQNDQLSALLHVALRRHAAISAREVLYDEPSTN